MPAPWPPAAEALVSWATTCRSPSTKHHLIITHEVTNVGTDRSQLAHMAKETKATLEAENLDVVADRGYFSSGEILACEETCRRTPNMSPCRGRAECAGRPARSRWCKSIMMKE